MNKEERAKVFFEAISKIAGFEIKPEKDFYIFRYDIKGIYNISEDLTLYYKTPNGYFRTYDYNIAAIFKGEYQFEEIKEPLLTDEEKDFLRHFKFEDLVVANSLHIYGKNNMFLYTIDLDDINHSFDGLEKYKRYSREELGLCVLEG